MINLLLAIVGVVFGLVAAAGAVYAAWIILVHRRQSQELQSKNMAEHSTSRSGTAALYPLSLLRWTWLDYIVLGLSLFGFLLLLADVIAVIRDRDSYPGYHYSYLICGVILAFMGMLMAFLRMVMLAQAIREARRHHE